MSFSLKSSVRSSEEIPSNKVDTQTTEFFMTEDLREFILANGYELPAEDDAEALLEILYEISEKDVPANVIRVDFAHSAEEG